MNDGRLAYDPDRLPWLPNEQRPPPRTPEPRPRRARTASGLPWATIVPWSLLALLLVAGLSYWLGMRSTQGPAPPSADRASPAPEASIRLPEPREAEPLPPPPVEVAPVIEPIEAQPQRPRAIREPKPERRAPAAEPTGTREPSEAEAADAAKAATSEERGAAEAAEAKKPAPKRLQAWPADVSSGASGRMVRIGTFRTSLQAKRGWTRLMRAYPGMRRLKAVVVPVQSMRNGQTYYRLQFGTTSQAHSTVLCQRMRMIGQSCVVVGL